MHLSELIYCAVKSCATAHQLWQILLDAYEEKATTTKIYLIWFLYNLWMKETDSMTIHLNVYENITS